MRPPERSRGEHRESSRPHPAQDVEAGMPPAPHGPVEGRYLCSIPPLATALQWPHGHAWAPCCCCCAPVRAPPTSPHCPCHRRSTPSRTRLLPSATRVMWTPARSPSARRTSECCLRRQRLGGRQGFGRGVNPSRG